MGHRRKAREYALQGLYMYETVGTPQDQIISFDWVEREMPEDIREFAEKLIIGAIEHLDEVDQLIEKHSKNWKIERLDNVDKSILRISVYAILHLTDIPVVVTINEGIELGKLYGGENSGQFINGVLNAIRKSDINKKGN